MSSGHRARSKLNAKELDDLLDEALANPKIKARLRQPFKLVTTFDIALLGSSGVGGHNVYLDRHLRFRKWPYGILPLENRRIDVKPPLIRHERLEQALEDELGWPYLPLAHPVAQHWEERLIKAKGFDPKAYEKMFGPYIKADEHERIVRCPTDLDLRPELSPPVDSKLIERIKQAQDAEKRSQTSVGYVDKSIRPPQRCGNCCMRVDEKYGGFACTYVKSPIVSGGWCRKWKRGSID